MPAVIESFAQLLKKGMFEVPNYQRNYAWTERELRDLWEDLGTIGDKGPPHFTGTIVIEKGKEPLFRHGDTYEMYSVIDGQQRLTTITILLFCIYDRLMELLESAKSIDVEKTSENVLRQYIRYEDIYKLKLGSSDDAYLKDVILKTEPTEIVGKPPQTPSQERLRAAKLFFKERLKDKDFDFLNRLIMKTTNWLQIIRYEVAHGIEACLLFEAMNDRGRQVGDFDKVKNHLIYTAYKEKDEDLANYVNEAWGEIFRNLMTIEGKGFDEEDLLRYHWVTMYGGTRTFNYRGFKEEIAKSPDILRSIRNYTDTMKELSYVLKEILDPLSEDSFADWKKEASLIEIRESLEGLRRLRAIATFIPLLLASRVAFSNLPAIFAYITQVCEVYAFRVYKLANRRADTGKSAIYGVANEFFGLQGEIVHYSDAKIRKTIRDNLAKVFDYIDYYCDDTQFEGYLKRKDIYSSYERSWLEGYEVRYLLYEYEKWKRLHEKHKEPPPAWKDVESNVTIEHILAESPEDYEKWSTEKRKVHKEIVHKLGNLTLATLEWNASLGSKSFDKKRIQYNESTFLVQRELHDYSEWWENEINRRADELIGFIMKRWKIPVETW